MANRNWSNGGKIYAMSVSPVMVTASITIGASGAVTSFAGALVQSVVRNSAGNYTITLMNGTNFNRIISTHASMQSPVSGLSGIGQIEFQNDPSTSMAVVATPAITIKCLAPAGTALDPVTGSVISVLIIANNSSVKS